jgi:CRISPR/Cas system CMR subunit Cmr4 (Cas7 group RAMP superfamily)
MVARNPDRIQIEYELTFDTLFHCGTGIREGLIDRTVTRDSKGYLYVPGSTFKGVLRERCEQLARLYEPEEQEHSAIVSPHNAEAALQEFGSGKPTMITRIFGSQMSPGRLFFDDARQDEDGKSQYGSGNDQGTYKELQVDLYTQVRLARPTRTAVAGALYTSEFGTRELVFKGAIRGWLQCFPLDSSLFAQPDPAPTYSLLLLLAGLRLVDRLGGNKSAGKGKCQCKITGLTMNGKACSEALWSSWLEHIDFLADYSKAQEG